MKARLRQEEGFGLIELTIAMVMLNIGILAIVAAFNSGAVTLQRANGLSNATVLADKQMELYRSLRNCALYLTNSQIPTSGPYVTSKPAGFDTYKITETYNGKDASNNAMTPLGPVIPVESNPQSLCYQKPLPPSTATTPSQTQVAPDGRSYPVDIYIMAYQPPNGGWTKQITVDVRDPRITNKVLVKEVSTFDPIGTPGGA